MGGGWERQGPADREVFGPVGVLTGGRKIYPPGSDTPHKPCQFVYPMAMEKGPSLPTPSTFPQPEPLFPLSPRSRASDEIGRYYHHSLVAATPFGNLVQTSRNQRYQAAAARLGAQGGATVEPRRWPGGPRYELSASALISPRYAPAVPTFSNLPAAGPAPLSAR